MIKQNIVAGIVSALSFLFFFLLLKWNIFVSLILAIGFFLAIYLLLKPVRKIGDVALENLKDGMELHALYSGAVNDKINLENAANAIANPLVAAKALRLAGTAQDILNYLEENPRDLSKSRHFLEYYFETAKKIVVNYVQLKEANISDTKIDHITDKTIEALDLLQKVFANQRDGYHKDKLMELDVETELLEKTIKLSGGDNE